MGSFCGPSQQEQNIAASNASFSTQLQQNYAQRFGQQSQYMTDLNNVISPVLDAGPSQQGFSPQELAAKNTLAINTTGANYANAARALGGQLSGRGGGGIGLTSGVDAQLKAALASSAAGNLSNEQLNITNQNYAQGNQNFQTALAGKNALIGASNPVGYAAPAVSSGNNAFGEADTVQQEKGQAIGDIFGAIAGGAADIFSGGLSGLSGIFGGSGKNQSPSPEDNPDLLG